MDTSKVVFEQKVIIDRIQQQL